jgi:isoquinoline 1-oxidoreductase alpha subunit
VKHQLVINGVSHTVHAHPDMPLLWVVRDFLGLAGTNHGHGRSVRAACTLQLDGRPIRGEVPLSAAVGARITIVDSPPQSRSPQTV